MDNLKKHKNDVIPCGGVEGRGVEAGALERSGRVLTRSLTTARTSVRTFIDIYVNEKKETIHFVSNIDLT